MDRRSFLQMTAVSAAAMRFPRAAFAVTGHANSTVNNLRQIVLSTNTTGLDAMQGDRIVELACVELINRKRSGRIFYQCINPERDVSAGAAAVHGLTLELLRDEPKFAEIAPALLEFVSDAELITHYAPFHIGFLNMELQLAGLPTFAGHRHNVIDTLRLAKELLPDMNMDSSREALCNHYNLNITRRRTPRMTMVEADLFAEIYLAMTKVV